MFSNMIFVCLCFFFVYCCLGQLTYQQQSSIFNAVIWPKLTGTTAVGSFFIRTNLNLDGYFLGGSIPEEIGMLHLVEEIWLSNHNLTGTLPNSIGQLPRLKKLYLDGNRLSGPVPDSLAHAEQLESLWLNDNMFTSVPATLGSQPALQELVLFHNAISSSVPNIHPGLSRCTLLNSNAPRNCWQCPLPDNIPSICIYGTYGFNVNDACTPNGGRRDGCDQATLPPSPIDAPTPVVPPTFIAAPTPIDAPTPVIAPTTIVSPTSVITPTPFPTSPTSPTPNNGVGSPGAAAPQTGPPPPSGGMDPLVIGLLVAGGAALLLSCWFGLLVCGTRMYRRRRLQKNRRERSATSLDSRRRASTRRPTSRRSTRRRGTVSTPATVNDSRSSNVGLSGASERRPSAQAGGPRPDIPADYDIAALQAAAGAPNEYHEVPATEFKVLPGSLNDGATAVRPRPRSEYASVGLVPLAGPGSPNTGNYDRVGSPLAPLPSNYDKVVPNLGEIRYSKLGPD